MNGWHANQSSNVSVHEVSAEQKLQNNLGHSLKEPREKNKNKSKSENKISFKNS